MKKNGAPQPAVKGKAAEKPRAKGKPAKQTPAKGADAKSERPKKAPRPHSAKAADGAGGAPVEAAPESETLLDQAQWLDEDQPTDRVHSTVYDFNASTSKGYPFKSLMEVLELCFRRVSVVIDDSRIWICEANAAKTLMVELNLGFQSFSEYVCSRRLSFQFTTTHAKGATKALKKKYSLSMYILKSDPGRLVFNLKTEKAGARTDVQIVNTIAIEYMGQQGWDEEHAVTPESGDVKYTDPITISSADFQKTKQLVANSKTNKVVKISFFGRVVSFYCDGSGLHDSKFSFGSNEGYDVSNARLFSKEFYSRDYHVLIKATGLCDQLLIFKPPIEGYPVKVHARIKDNDGSVTFWVKDKEQIDKEAFQEQREKPSHGGLDETKRRARREKKAQGAK